MNKTTKIILLALLGIILVGGIAYGEYRLLKNSCSTVQPSDNQATQSDNQQATESADQQSSPSALIDQIQTTDNMLTQPFEKKLFNSEDIFFFDYKFPQRLVDTDENTLVLIRCSNRYYTTDYEMTKAYVKNASVRKLNDASVIEFLKRNQAAQKIESIMFCETEQNEKIVVYRRDYPFGEGGTESFTVIGFLQKDLSLTHIYELKANAGSSACVFPLMYTKNRELYIQCLGGDTFHPITNLEVIDLEKLTHRVIFSCEGSYDEESQKCEEHW